MNGRICYRYYPKMVGILLSCFTEHWDSTHFMLQRMVYRTFQLIEIYVKLSYVNIMQQFTSYAFTDGIKTLKLNLRGPFCHCLTFITDIDVLFLQGKQ